MSVARLSHDHTALARVVLFALLGLVALYSVRLFVSLEAPLRRRVARWAAAIVFVGVIFVLLRHGLHWFAVGGTAALAVAKQLVPVAFRLLPFAQRLWRRSTRARNSGPGFADFDASPGSDRAERQGESASSANAGPQQPRRGRPMNTEEALEVLGLRSGASREEISMAYKNLMRKVHPDIPGGSTYLASKLNQAKQTLLG